MGKTILFFAIFTLSVVHEVRAVDQQKDKAFNDPTTSQGGPKPLKNPIAELFQINDPNTKQGLDAVYGAYNGDMECTKQLFCIVGNSLHNLPAREIVFTMLRNYVPEKYSLYYDILRVSTMYGQNCTVYRCVQQPVNDPIQGNNIPQ